MNKIGLAHRRSKNKLSSFTAVPYVNIVGQQPVIQPGKSAFEDAKRKFEGTVELHANKTIARSVRGTADALASNNQFKAASSVFRAAMGGIGGSKEDDDSGSDDELELSVHVATGGPVDNTGSMVSSSLGSTSAAQKTECYLRASLYQGKTIMVTKITQNRVAILDCIAHQFSLFHLNCAL